MLRPPSANVFNSDSLFKALGLLCQRNGYAIVFNVSTLFGSEVRLPMYQMEPHSTDCRVILYKLTHFSEEWILRYTRSYLYLFLTEHPHQRPSHTPKVFPFWDWRNVNPTYRSTQVGKIVSLLKLLPIQVYLQLFPSKSYPHYLRLHQAYSQSMSTENIFPLIQLFLEICFPICHHCQSTCVQ